MMEDENSTKKAYIVLFIIPILWGSTIITAKIMTSSIDVLLMQGVRHVIALFGFIPFILYSRKKDAQNISKVKSCNKILILTGIITGSCNGIAMLVQTYGLQTTTASKTGFLTSTYIVITPFLAYFLYKKQISKISIIAVFIALLGVFILSVDFTNLMSLFILLIGDILILIASLLFAFQIVITEHYIDKIKNLGAFSFIQVSTVSIICFILTIFNPNAYKIPKITSSYWFLWFYLGLIATTLPFFFQNYGQRRVDSTKAVLIFSIEPIFASLFGIIFGNEIINWQLAVGGAIILFASYLVIIFSKNKNSENNF